MHSSMVYTPQNHC